MADIFISYANADRPTARRLADALETCGWSVWWDHGNLRGGQHFHHIIEEAIHSARIVVAVWSKASIESRWVRDEATLALEENKLVPLRIDMARLPLGFRSIHTIDLASWTGETDAEPFDRLVKDLSHYLGPPNASGRSEHPGIPTAPIPGRQPPLGKTSSRQGRLRSRSNFWGVSKDRQPAPTDPSIEATVPKPPDPKPPNPPADAAVTAFDRGDYVTVLSFVRPAAERGDRAAQHVLGWLYDNGKGVPQDYAEAAHWFQKAADQGHADAQNNLGLLYRNGQGVPQDDAEAAGWYRKAANQGTAQAQHNLGVLYLCGQGVVQDYPKALHWFRKAADQGNALAQRSLGALYLNGWGVPQDKVQARAWMQKAAAAGDDDAKEWLAKN
jgi:hypothetical protein